MRGGAPIPLMLAATIEALHEAQDTFPLLARSALHGIVAQLRALATEITRIERQILEWHRRDDTSRRLATIPGIGPITASALAAAVSDASLLRSGRQFAAWLSLTPRVHRTFQRSTSPFRAARWPRFAADAHDCIMVRTDGCRRISIIAYGRC